jgi:hypothetical protein
MWTVMKRATLVAAGLLLFTGGTARASVMNVNVPFPFIVQGHTLPAGQYEVDREDTDPSVILIRGENGSKVGRFVLTIPAGGHDPAGDMPALTFSRWENQYRLTDIWESAAQGHEIPTRR